MSLPPVNNQAATQRRHSAERKAVATIVEQFPGSPSLQTNMTTTSSFIQDSLAEHNRRVESGEILPFLPSPEPLQPQRIRRVPINWNAIGDSTQDDTVPWSPEGARSRQTEGSTWEGQQMMPTDKLAGELNSMMKKRRRESSGSEYVVTTYPIDLGQSLTRSHLLIMVL